MTPLHRRKGLLLFLSLSLLCVLALASGLYRLLEFPLVVNTDEKPPQDFDAVVVFSGGCRSDGTLGMSTRARILAALETFRPGTPILLMGGFTCRRGEKNESGRRILTENGVPPYMIWDLQRSRITREDAQEASAFLLTLGARHPLLITSPYHQRRVVLIFSRVFPYTFHVYSGPFQGETFTGFWGKWHHLGLILHEYGGILLWTLWG